MAAKKNQRKFKVAKKSSTGIQNISWVLPTVKAP
jgi:hypothetical protein